MKNKGRKCLKEDTNRNVWYSIASDIQIGPNAILIRIHSNNDNKEESNEVLFHQISPMLAYFNRKKKSNTCEPIKVK